MSRVILRGLCVAALACTALVRTSGAADAEPKPYVRPNILVFIVDDMGAGDAGCYGNPHVRTPNLDRLAAEGVRFDAAFLTCSSCSPSRASILTGRYPHSTGAHQLHLPVPAEQLFVSEVLRDDGYYTAAAGKWHLGGPAKAKFDRVVEGIGEWVSVLRDRPKEKPFFLWLATTDPHRPYEPDAIADPHSPADAVVPPYLPDVPQVREDFSRYYDEVTRADADLGRVLDELDRQGVAEDTAVVFLSDNGRPFPRCKTTLYDSGIATPLVVRWPAQAKAGQTRDNLVSSVDLAATFCEWAGVPRPEPFQGRSLSAVFEHPQAAHRDEVFAEHNWHDYEARERAVRTRRWKYIRNYYRDVPGTPPADAVRSPTFEAMRRLRDEGKLTPAQQSVFVAPRPHEELYDLSQDPHELRNLAGDPELEGVLAELRGRLKAWAEETDDVDTPRRPDGFDRETGLPLKNPPR